MAWTRPAVTGYADAMRRPKFKTSDSRANGRHIGRLIKKARLKHRLKAEEVAERCNVSRSRVYSWEASRSIFPKNLKTLSRALDIPLGRLRKENGAD
jgi:DNA-binding transcriptional regulator YiaG